MAYKTNDKSMLNAPVGGVNDSTIKLVTAEECLKMGLFLWDAETQEQEDTCARLVGTPEEVSLMDYEGYRAGVLCFEAGLALDPDHAHLQTMMGEAFYFGKGVPQDSVLALCWFRKAAAQAEPHAEYLLGWMYAHGQGVRMDMEEAVKCYRRAAIQGHEGARQAIEEVAPQ